MLSSGEGPREAPVANFQRVLEKVGRPLIFMEFVSLTEYAATSIVENRCRHSKYNRMPDSQLKALEKKIDELIELCAQLNRENQLLKSESASWQRERQTLVQKNELARTKVAAMLDRLRKLEHE
jgi:cell division protein ZapB